MPAPVNPPCAPFCPNGSPGDGTAVADLPALLYAGGPAPVTRMLARLERRRMARSPRAVPAPAAGEPPATTAPTPDEALATIDRELAQLFAARELYMTWVQAARAEGAAELNPATFLRAWCDSTGRVIQLLRARRDLGGGDAADALLDAVYAELELQLPAISVASASAELELQGHGISTASASAELELPLPAISTASASAELGPQGHGISAASASVEPDLQPPALLDAPTRDADPVAVPAAEQGSPCQPGFRNREPS